MTTKNIEITPCYHLEITFDSTEGLNKFVEFLLNNKINSSGFEKISNNTTYKGICSEEEITKIKEYLKYESKQK